MRRSLPLLESAEIESPCQQDWRRMHGDRVRRYCDSCQLHVHNLTAMTGAEAERLLEDSGGRVCIRMVRDKRGRPITLDRYTFGVRLPFGLTRYLRHIVAALAFLIHASGCVITGSPVPPQYGPLGRGRIPKQTDEHDHDPCTKPVPCAHPADTSAEK